MDILYFLFVYVYLLCFFWKIYAVTDNISPSHAISDGKTLVSNDGSFELGFFSPASSKKRYVGIWYKNIPIRTVVWVANRESPIEDSSGVLMINRIGNLVLVNQYNNVVWSLKSLKEASIPILQLLDSGNLVLRDEKDTNSDVYLWQSFDYPSDTLLPGMKLGWDLRNGLNRRLSSWKNSDDPSPGDLIWGIELHKYPDAALWKGSRKYFRSGPWNGLRFSGNPQLRSNPVFEFNFVSNWEEVYYIYRLMNASVISRIVLNQTTYSRERYVWMDAEQIWKLYAAVPQDYCDNYGLCGANGICVISGSPVCQCLKGFKPVSPEKWNSLDWSQGCIHDKPLKCQITEGFVKFVDLKLPDTTNSYVNETMNLNECREKCSENCSCMAYTNSDVRGQGSGCALWFGDLIDIRQLPIGGQDLYIRMPDSNLEAKDGPTVKIHIVIVSVIGVVSAMLIVSYCIYKAKTNSRGKTEENIEVLDLPLSDFATIATATDNFSINKKVGEGGFGPVYKGKLVDGQEIAVKRLSKSSGQGLDEFKNEVLLIAKLQHRNLVKLIGCCIQGDEKMLIYEYMPNGSLDSFIFDQRRRKLLDWPKCFHIICGIGRGLLYLHQDSRLRIIHRDLKASNVLLDNELNPRISDFGLARTFGGDQSEGNTNRVVGTYGYMAPEYAIHGLFSVKSDIFSFGVLLLEILSGKKNRGFHHPSHHLDLIGHAWRLWTEERPIELIDTLLLEQSCNVADILRCIHVGLLCVQHHPEDRPNMSSVVLMLNGESALSHPKPGFLIDISTSPSSCSVNEITETPLEPR